MSPTFEFDGSEVHARDGQTIAGALIADGRAAWRTADGAERGVFCGIGICQDCTVTVNGAAGVRACLRAACEGDVVEPEARHHARCFAKNSSVRSRASLAAAAS